MQDFRKLRAWHAAHQLALRVLDSIPERDGRRAPGLRGQITRAADSVHANLAEGCGRGTRGEFLQFIEISVGSLNELDTQLLAARNYRILNHATHKSLHDDLVSLRKQLFALRRAVQHALALEQDRKLPTPRDRKPANDRGRPTAHNRRTNR